MRARIGQTIFIALLCLSIFFKLGFDFEGIQGKMGLFFFFCTNQTFAPLFGVLFAFLGERKLFLREYANKTYGVVPYYIAKTIVEMPIMILMPVLFLQLVYYGVGLTITVERVLMTNLIMVLLVFTTSALGFLVGSVFTNEAVAIRVAPLALTPAILFAGFFFNLNTVYVWLRWLQWVSPIRYALEALIRNEFDDNDRYNQQQNYYGTSDFNKNPGSPAEQLGYNLGLTNCLWILFGLGIGLRIIALIGLKLGVRKVQS